MVKLPETVKEESCELTVIVTELEPVKAVPLPILKDAHVIEPCPVKVTVELPFALFKVIAPVTVKTQSALTANSVADPPAVKVKEAIEYAGVAVTVTLMELLTITISPAAFWPGIPAPPHVAELFQFPVTLAV